MLKHTLIAALLAASGHAHADATPLNVSCDVSREFYEGDNAAFAKHWQANAGKPVSITQPPAHLRPRLACVAARHAGQFPTVQAFTVEEVFGGWQKAQKIHFADGSVFDQIYLK